MLEHPLTAGVMKMKLIWNKKEINVIFNLMYEFKGFKHALHKKVVLEKLKIMISKPKKIMRSSINTKL